MVQNPVEPLFSCAVPLSIFAAVSEHICPGFATSRPIHMHPLTFAQRAGGAGGLAGRALVVVLKTGGCTDIRAGGPTHEAAGVTHSHSCSRLLARARALSSLLHRGCSDGQTAETSFGELEGAELCAGEPLWAEHCAREPRRLGGGAKCVCLLCSEFHLVHRAGPDHAVGARPWEMVLSQKTREFRRTTRMFRRAFERRCTGRSCSGGGYSSQQNTNALDPSECLVVPGWARLRGLGLTGSSGARARVGGPSSCRFGLPR